MKKLLLSLFLCTLVLTAGANDFEVDGVYYNITSIKDNTCEVCSYNRNNKPMYLSIPSKVSCMGRTYIVTSIVDWAFSDDNSLTSVSIPNTVTNIGVGVFYGCSSLTSIKVDVDNPSYDSREKCNAIIETSTNTLICACRASIIPYGVTSIGDYAYFGLGTTNLTLPNSVINIGSHAFGGCAALTSLSLPNSVTNIGDYAFSNCGLSSVTIPNSVASIGSGSFEYCSALTSVTIPNSVTSIGDNAFYGCKSISSVIIPQSLMNIGEGAFSNCKELSSLIVDADNPYYDSRENCNAIIETRSNNLICGCQNSIIPNGVISIGNDAFSGCGRLTNVSIPSSVTSIGNNAFNSCGLSSLTIPNSVTKIGDYAFSSCISIASLLIPNSVDSIGDYAFAYCFGIKSLTIGNNVTSIGEGTFEGCSGLTSVTVPNSVIKIGDYAFQGCKGLTNVVIPNSVTSIGNYTFEYCSLLTNVSISGNLTSIGDYAFNGCSSLMNISIPSSVTSIGGRVFAETGWYNSQNDGLLYLDGWLLDCKDKRSVSGMVTIQEGTKGIANMALNSCVSITGIKVPNSVKIIGKQAFVIGGAGMENIIVDEDNPFFDSRLNCNAIIETNSNTLVCGCQNTFVPNSVTGIGNYAFYGCYGLTEIVVPDNVTIIGDFAFSNCGLKEVSIGNGVTSIGDWAFYSCLDLTSVSIGSGIVWIGSKAFFCSPITSFTCEAPFPPECGDDALDISSSSYLYVPKGCSSVYGSAEQWKEFFFVYEIDTHADDINILPKSMLFEGKYYDVWGHSHDNPVKGINIVNGSKVIL